MVDIHCHILPGMDDGASDFKTAEQMLQTAAEDGIDTLICTPHYSPKAYRDCPRVLEKLAGSAKAAGIRLLPGMEYSFARLDAEIANLRPLGESSFVLIDLGVPNLPPSIEELFFSKNITTGIAVAHARGVILYTAERLHLPVYEYTPMQIKQAVVGYGLADKHQVMDMTRRLLKLRSIPRPDDAADALAIAMCHARSATSLLRRKDPDVKETV